jgi:hypothetical protein
LKTIVRRRPGMSIAELNDSELSRVQQRLINCNLRRRHRFLYAQRHAEELQQVRPAPKLGGNGVKVSKSIDSGSQKSLNSQQSSSQAIVSPQPVQRSSGRSERTGTTASAVSDSYPLPQDPNPTPSQVAPTQVSATATKIHYPRPPFQSQNRALTFQCPCCCQTFPTIIAKGNRWK